VAGTVPKDAKPKHLGSLVDLKQMVNPDYLMIK
jgi:hypothetical protein